MREELIKLTKKEHDRLAIVRRLLCTREKVRVNDEKLRQIMIEAESKVGAEEVRLPLNRR